MNTTNYREMYRPQYHFTPEKNWMNDPNGMVYYEGEYHLFYQHHPYSSEWGPMHWGHAISDNLVHWEHLPIALEPDHNGFIFSGSVVVDWHDSSGFFSGKCGLVAIFTHADTYCSNEVVDMSTARPRQRQSIAYSKDKGRTWTMYDGNPVLLELDITDFRDPKVFWHEQSHRWVMVIAAGDHIRLYASSDLKDWSYLSAFGEHSGSHAGVWECPDLFELPVEGVDDTTKWVMIVSIGDDPQYIEGSRTQYFIGYFDGITFTNDHTPDTVIWLDHGRDNYAGVTWSDTLDSNRILIGWMSNWKYANLLPTTEWRSAMTLPRVLSLKHNSDGVRLIQTAVENLQHLREEVMHWERLTVVSGDMLLPSIEGNQLEIEVEFEISSALEFGFKLGMSDHEHTVIGYDVHKEELFIDRTRSGKVDFHDDFPCKHGASLYAINHCIKLHIFIDWSSIEVFANDGSLVMTDQIFPDPSRSGLTVYALGGNAAVRNLNIHQLKSIFKSSAIKPEMKGMYLS